MPKIIPVNPAALTLPLVALALLGCGDQRAPSEPPIDAATVDSVPLDSGNECPCTGFATCEDDVCTLAPGLADEAITQLGRIEAALRAAYARDGHFPAAAAAATPMATCCAAGGVTLCPANPSAWVGFAAWDALGFSIATEHAFVYAYSSDGQRAQALAFGDLDCDTVMSRARR